MQDKGLKDVLLTGGGIIPDADTTVLSAMGIGTLFTPGANTSDIADYIRTWVAEHRK
jgi:methylmalonyl-CoA mutase, C-terminal domain